MSDYLDFAAAAGLRVRGTVLVVPGRGETSATYRRFGARIATDSYTVRVLASPVVTTSAADALASLDAALSAALASLLVEPIKPLVLVGADTGATTLAALVARSPVSGSTDLPAWWPDALVLASPPALAATWPVATGTPSWMYAATARYTEVCCLMTSASIAAHYRPRWTMNCLTLPTATPPTSRSCCSSATATRWPTGRRSTGRPRHYRPHGCPWCATPTTTC